MAFLLSLLTHPLPLEISRHGDYRVESVEQSLEGYSLVDVEIEAYGIHHNPEHPLLDVFLGERPQSHEAHGIREGVEHGHRTVCEADEHPIRGIPRRKEGERHGQVSLQRHVGDGDYRLGTVLAAALCSPCPTHYAFEEGSVFPHHVAVDTGNGIVCRHTGVAVESVLPVEPDVEGGHDYAYEPQGYVGTVFEPYIEQSKEGREDVEPVGGEEFGHDDCLFN